MMEQVDKEEMEMQQAIELIEKNELYKKISSLFIDSHGGLDRANILTVGEFHTELTSLFIKNKVVKALQLIKDVEDLKQRYDKDYKVLKIDKLKINAAYMKLRLSGNYKAHLTLQLVAIRKYLTDILGESNDSK